MSKLKDSSAIKLFGQMIPLLTTLNQKEASSIADCCDANLLSSSDDHGDQVLESIAKEFVVNDEHDVDNTETEKNSSLKTSKNEETSDQKTLKKPDKILPCPRCNSNETKFCYYNNYNVNQPRHFCKNCQRYWTAGGTMRNLPVGAGRRKTKSSMTISSALHHYHQIMISEAIREAQASCANLLTFGSSGSSSKQENDGDKIHQWLPKWIPQGFPVAYFNSNVVQSSWGVPLMASAAAAAAASSTSPNSPTPRKQSRDDHQNIDHLVKSKTMRIDDPGETAKSIMLATLVNKSKSNSSSTTNISSGGGMFDGFQSKFNCNERSYRVESFPSAAAVLQANPAAMSRSLNFRENT